MRLSDFDYELPECLIATEPANPRDSSRLLVLRRDKSAQPHLPTGIFQHRHFYDIVDYLEAGDVLVVNDSKVFPARLHGRKESGGKLEVFLHRRVDGGEKCSHAERGQVLWQCLIGGRGAKPDMVIAFDEGLSAEIKSNNDDGTWNLAFNLSEEEMMAIVFKIGEVPLPPYIKKSKCKNQNVKLRNDYSDKISYQTIYADDAKAGSVAAPTAGLHFTDELIASIKAKGVKIVHVTLHVGLGTFAPVKTDNILKHKMHEEWYEVKEEVIETILEAKRLKHRVISVGTTSTRVLETVFSRNNFSHNAQRITQNENKEALRVTRYELRDLSGWTDIFIYPGYEFKIIDGMITNFHLPKSTLIMLVSALAGKENVFGAYREAIDRGYRFYSYGDAMLII